MTLYHKRESVYKDQIEKSVQKEIHRRRDILLKRGGGMGGRSRKSATLLDDSQVPKASPAYLRISHESSMK
jgi:hypothetical protein